jgi:hypothetical protein
MSSPTATDTDNYQGYLNYYDFGFVAYTNYYRTGDQRFLDCARKVTDSWWSQPVIDYGKNLVSLSGNSLAPRSVALNGLILRALDGRPEMWAWITDYVNYQFHGWDEVPKNWDGLYFGVRDGGFMLLYAAEIGAVHPDPAVRADFKNRALSVAVNYYTRLQQIDGSYRWNVEDSVAGNKDGFTGMEQPFMVGILNEGMIAVHRLTGDEKVKSAILKSAEHEFTKSYNANGWRAPYYFIHGQFNTGFSCESGCGNASNPFPPGDKGEVFDARQLNATMISQYGYAYYITKDEKYLKWGDEVFDATYSGNDGYRGIAGYRGKEYDESYRSGGKYLAWRLGGPSGPLPSPTGTAIPTPSATVTPVPTVSPTPSGNTSVDGTKGLTITDATGGIWTFGLNKETLRNGVHTGGGFGLVYKWLTGFVYVEGTNGAWYRWTGDSWAGAGDSEPGGASPTPTATPTATPLPSVTPSPLPSPTVQPSPTVTPTPTPTPPICTMTIVSVPTLSQWGSGKLVISLSGFGSPSSVTATSTDGQVSVSPPRTRTISGANAIVEFGLQAKKKSAAVTITGPCGPPQSVMVNVR